MSDAVPTKQYFVIDKGGDLDFLISHTSSETDYFTESTVNCTPIEYKNI